MDNIILEKVIGDCRIQTGENFFYKEVQLLAYTDDIDITNRSASGLREAWIHPLNLWGLDQDKTKTQYTVFGNDTYAPLLQIQSYTFDKVRGFVYLEFRK